MTSSTMPELGRIFIVGAGRLGRALAAALAATGTSVTGPLRRGERVTADRGDDVVLLCVPDAAIRDTARAIAPGPLVGHCSGALALDALGSHAGFSMHPLVTAHEGGAEFQGAGCAIAGRSPRALAAAHGLALQLHMIPFQVDDAHRALYHAAASMASNYLVTLESAAERVAATAGVERRHLAHIARATLESWTTFGGRAALSGPIARGDEATVALQREAVAAAAPDLLPLWDALAAATRTLARQP